MSNTKETCHISCRSDANVCNDSQLWNNDKCSYKCNELIDHDRCDDGIIWNLSTCKCERDKSCEIGRYLYYKFCRFGKRLVDKLV